MTDTTVPVCAGCQPTARGLARDFDCPVHGRAADGAAWRTPARYRDVLYDRPTSNADLVLAYRERHADDQLLNGGAR